ncbi:gliding motility-associated C-terminal domain-containing protein [Olleya aquimaris]|nr:gliding motility-associated C-terminal domain-containing protein [Olleya aquimaris]
MQTISQNSKLYLIVSLFVITVLNTANAQIVISKPQLGFSQACANEGFNTFSATFVFAPDESVEASNQFTIELSDSNGDFSNPTNIFITEVGQVITSPATLNFQFPENTAGEGYRIRIKSSAPVATSTPSDPFAAYYKLHDIPFTINNLVSTAAYCSGSSYLLTIDNPGTGNNISPLIYPSLTYLWYRETGPTTSEFVGEGSSLSVDEEGTYFVETNYGSCTSDSFSNRVTISESISGVTNIEISSSLGTNFCPDQGATVLSTVNGNSYQWYKNGIIIPDATEQSYETTESGTFAVQVDLGGCSGAGEIILDSQEFIGAINVDDTNELAEGESLSVILSDTAISPEYQWLLNGQIISGVTQNNYNATELGDYEIIVTETQGCETSVSFFFSIIEPFNPFPDIDKIPNLISPNGDNINDTWIIPQEYTAGSDTQITILTNRGEVVFQSNEYLNNWPENDLELTNINKVFYYIITTSDNQVKKGSITIIK